MKAHTPGEWYAKNDGGTWLVNAPMPTPTRAEEADQERLLEDGELCLAYLGIDVDGSMAADARLMAAAPDLLEGARELVALLRRMPNAGAILAPQTTGLRVLTQAEAAIAKATGGSA